MRTAPLSDVSFASDPNASGWPRPRSDRSGGREEVMMFHRIQQYELIHRGGRWYRPWAYGDRQLDGIWDGWLVFFPIGFRIDGFSAIAAPGSGDDAEHVDRARNLGSRPDA